MLHANPDSYRVLLCVPDLEHSHALRNFLVERGFTVVRECVDAVDLAAAALVEPVCAW